MNNNDTKSEKNIYGSKGQSWHNGFVDYMHDIANHPVYKGMPDAIKEDGKIQWEAPSNRSSGKYKDTYQKRLIWWQEKAQQIGIKINESQWISETAKKIHPFGKKPCKKCGLVLSLSYVYPTSNFQTRINKEFNGIQIDRLDSIQSIIQTIYDSFGEKGLKKLPSLLSTKHISINEDFTTPNEWITWIEQNYVPLEPSMLSPGAMSNAPDRFDGFHSFNKCCREKADPGRSKENLRSYSTDRRAFEYWTEGNWAAADKLMGIISSQFREEKCVGNKNGPCSADHIGPISLGFCHRPEFRLLTKEDNSGKNNRMTLWDIAYLKSIENNEHIVSWYAQPLWNAWKNKIDSDEKALRLSKLLRDNQRNVMSLLGQIYANKHYTFLLTLLGLRYAEYNYDFKNLMIKNYLTVFDQITAVHKNTKYVLEQKSRRIRIGFDALTTYNNKANRHWYHIRTNALDDKIKSILSTLDSLPEEIHKLNNTLHTILSQDNDNIKDTQLREFVQNHTFQNNQFKDIFTLLMEAVEILETELSTQWENDRYKRADFDFDEN